MEARPLLLSHSNKRSLLDESLEGSFCFYSKQYHYRKEKCMYGVYKVGEGTPIVTFNECDVAQEWASEEDYPTEVKCLCVEHHFKGSIHKECYEMEEHTCHERRCECDCHYEQ